MKKIKALILVALILVSLLLAAPLYATESHDTGVSGYGYGYSIGGSYGQ